MEQVKKLFEKSHLPAAKLWGTNLHNGEEWKMSFNYSENDDEIFRIASMTKLLTTIGSLQLVERGEIKLDEPVNKYIPSISDVGVIDEQRELKPPDSEVTLTHLLTHTSGFAYPFTSEILDSYLDRPRGPANPREFLTWPKVFNSGENFCYGVGIDWVGKLIETISGKTLEDYFRENITGPLGMDSTWFNPPSELHKNIVDYQVRNGGSFEIAGPRIPDTTDFFGGGGGLMSSAKDYMELLKCLYHGGQLDGIKILNDTTVDLMFEDHLPKELHIGMTEAPEEHSWSNNGQFCQDMSSGRWGLGWALESEDTNGLRSPRTAYWAGIFNTYFTLDRGKGIAVLYFSQFLPFDDDEAYQLYKLFEEEVYRCSGFG